MARIIYEWLDAFVFALAAVIVLFVFVFKAYMVRGTSMEPTLVEGNRVFVYSLFYQPKPGDVVVLDESLKNGDSIVKRIVAVENQTVDISEETGEITVDGAVFDIVIDTSLANLAGDMRFPATVPEGYVFVMGDNRSASYDSRYTAVGFIDERKVIGHALYILSPISEAGAVE